MANDTQKTCGGIKDQKLLAICERETATCNELGSENLVSYCGSMISSCTEQLNRGASSYQLFTPDKKPLKNLIDARMCFTASPSFAKAFGSKAPSETKEKAPADKTAAKVAKVSEENFIANGSTKFAVDFNKAGFRIHTESDGKPKPLTLIFSYNDAIIGIKLHLGYTVGSSDNENYEMKYSFFKRSGDTFEPIGKEETIKFKASDGTISDNLAFGITLAEDGNAGTLSSVKIVKLK